MPKIKIIEENPVPMAVVKQELDAIKKRDTELNFRANVCHEYVQNFAHLDAKKTHDVYTKIEKLDIPRLRSTHITKIIDLLPTTGEQVKAILQGYTISLSTENCKKIVDVVAEFLEKK